MSIKRISSLLIASFLAIAAVAVAAVDTCVVKAFALYAAAKEVLFNVVTGPVPMASVGHPEPKRGIVQAVAFVQRIIKRDRPVLTPRWRMCPST